jgi:hypothetical protein
VSLALDYVGSGGVTGFRSNLQSLLDAGTPFAGIQVRDCDGVSESCSGTAIDNGNGTPVPIPSTLGLLGAGLVGLGILARRRTGV